MYAKETVTYPTPVELLEIEGRTVEELSADEAFWFGMGLPHDTGLHLDAMARDGSQRFTRVETAMIAAAILHRAAAAS